MIKMLKIIFSVITFLLGVITPAFSANCSGVPTTKTVSFRNGGDFNGLIKVTMATLSCPSRDTSPIGQSVSSFANQPLSTANFALPFGNYSFCFEFTRTNTEGQLETRNQVLQMVSVTENSLDPINEQISPSLLGSKLGPCESSSDSMGGMASSDMSTSELFMVLCMNTGTSSINFENTGSGFDSVSVVVEKFYGGCVNPAWATFVEAGKQGSISLPEGTYDICYDFPVTEESAVARYNHKIIKSVSTGSTITLTPSGGSKGFCRSIVFEANVQEVTGDNCLNKKAIIRVKGNKFFGFFEPQSEGKSVLGILKGTSRKGKVTLVKGGFFGLNGETIGNILKGSDKQGIFFDSEFNFNSRDLFLDYKETNGCTGTLAGNKIE